MLILDPENQLTDNLRQRLSELRAKFKFPSLNFEKVPLDRIVKRGVQGDLPKAIDSQSCLVIDSIAPSNNSNQGHVLCHGYRISPNDTQDTFNPQRDPRRFIKFYASEIYRQLSGNDAEEITARKNIRRICELINEQNKEATDNLTMSPAARIVNCHFDDKYFSYSVPFLEMEYIEGQTLEELCKRQTASGNKVDYLRACSLIKATCDSLIKLRSNSNGKEAFHRDLKPSNLMLETSTGCVVVIDLDGMILSSASQMTEATRFLHHQSINLLTPEFAAPEVHHSPDSHTEASEQYSLAVCLYKLITNRFPFESREDKLQKGSQPKPIPSIPEELWAVISRALSYDPGWRYESLQDFADKIGCFQAELEEILFIAKERGEHLCLNALRWSLANHQIKQAVDATAYAKRIAKRPTIAFWGGSKTGISRYLQFGQSRLRSRSDVPIKFKLAFPARYRIVDEQDDTCYATLFSRDQLWPILCAANQEQRGLNFEKFADEVSHRLSSLSVAENPTPESFEFTAGLVNALRLLKRAGYLECDQLDLLEKQMVASMAYLPLADAIQIAKEIFWEDRIEFSQIWDSAPGHEEVIELSLSALQEFLIDASTNNYGICRRFLIREVVVPVPTSTLPLELPFSIDGLDSAELNTKQSDYLEDHMRALKKLAQFDLLDLPGAIPVSDSGGSEDLSIENAMITATSNLAFEVSQCAFSFEYCCMVWNFDEALKHESVHSHDASSPLAPPNKHSEGTGRSGALIGISRQFQSALSGIHEEKKVPYFILIACSKILDNSISSSDTLNSLVDLFKRHIAEFEVVEKKRLVFAAFESLRQVSSEKFALNAKRMKGLEIYEKLGFGFKHRLYGELQQMLYSSISPGAIHSYFDHVTSQFNSCPIGPTDHAESAKRLAEKLQEEYRTERASQLDEGPKLLRQWITQLTKRFGINIDPMNTSDIYQIVFDSAQAIKSLTRIPPEWLPIPSFDDGSNVPFDFQLANYVKELVDTVIDKKASERCDLQALGIEKNSDHKLFLEALFQRTLLLPDSRNSIGSFVHQMVSQDDLSAKSATQLLAVKLETILFKRAKQSHNVPEPVDDRESSFSTASVSRNSPDLKRVINPFIETLEEAASI